VRSGQRKEGVVIEFRSGPGGSVVAGHAGLGKPGGCMVGVGGLLIINQVTTDTVSRRTRKTIVHVTLGALNSGVGPGQGEERTVIEFRARPGCRPMALRTGLRESGGSMIWVGGLVVVSKVTANTISRRAGKASVDVALLARESGMRSRQRESGESQVVEFCACPGGGGVTL